MNAVGDDSAAEENGDEIGSPVMRLLKLLIGEIHYIAAAISEESWTLRVHYIG